MQEPNTHTHINFLTTTRRARGDHHLLAIANHTNTHYFNCSSSPTPSVCVCVCFFVRECVAAVRFPISICNACVFCVRSLYAMRLDENQIIRLGCRTRYVCAVLQRRGRDGCAMLGFWCVIFSIARGSLFMGCCDSTIIECASCV